MNAKTERQIENLKNQTIGVEIEMNHITRERAAKLASQRVDGKLILPEAIKTLTIKKA